MNREIETDIGIGIIMVAVAVAVAEDITMMMRDFLFFFFLTKHFSFYCSMHIFSLLISFDSFEYLNIN